MMRGGEMRLLVAMLLAAGFLLGGGNTRARAGAATPAVGVPEAFSGDVQLSSMACVDAHTCYAIGEAKTPDGGTLFTLTNGALSGAQPLGPSGTAGWKDLACSDDGTCYAIGSNGSAPQHTLILPIVNGSPGTVQDLGSDIFLGAGVNAGLACDSTATCYASGAQGSSGVIVPIANGQAGQPIPIPGTSYLFDLDCPAAGTCYAVGTCTSVVAGCEESGGAIALLVNGRPGPVEAFPASGGSPNLTSLACPSVDQCYAGGSLVTSPPDHPRGLAEGVVLPVVDGRPASFQRIPGAAWLYGFACPTSQTCFAVGQGSGTSENGETLGVIVPVTNGMPGTPVTVDVDTPLGMLALMSGGCTGSNACYAMSWNGIVPLTPQYAGPAGP